MYNTHHTLSKEECQGEICSHLDAKSSACGWPIWLKGQSAKGLASTVSRYTSVELALHP